MPEAQPEVVSENLFCSVCKELSDVINLEIKNPCPNCKKFFCKTHTSTVDPDYCDNCLRPQNVATEDGVLTDEDGVNHEGRRIVLTGDFWASMTRDVRLMTDSELENHLVSLRTAVREIEVIRDYRKIALAHAENENEERRVGKLRRLRLIKDVRSGRLSAKEVIEFKKAKAKPKSNVAAIADNLKAAGITREQLEALLKGIKK